MKTYDKYKSSGIDWIGDIPEHWEMRKISRSFETIGSGTTPTAGSEEYYTNGTINWINTGDLNDGILTSCKKKITELAFDKFSTLKIYPKGTLLIAMYGATIGKTAILDFEACTNQACCALADSKIFHSKYVFYWFLSSKTDIINLSYGGGQPNISQEIIRFLKLPSPTLLEQTAIADYLDEKTAQTDKLIAEKRRLIELLKEERLGVINQAVTRGINRNAKLKPSGIAWLGDIPEHWEVKRLKFITKIKYGLGQPPNQKDDGLPLIRATNIERGRIVEKDLLFVDPEDIPYDRDPILKENDIIVVRSGAYTADSAIIPKKFDGAIAGYDMVLRVYKDSPFFIAFCLLSNYVLINQLYLERLRAAQPHLNKEELGETLIMLPPIEEQKQIVEFIETATGKIDATIATIEKEIGFLREYRTALISEVVTGKIKVV